MRFNRSKRSDTESEKRMMDHIHVRPGVHENVAAAANAPVDSRTSSLQMHEVTVKVLGLKSVVSDLQNNLRVVVGTLNNGEVSAKTTLSTEFGHLHDERMSLAVWNDKDASHSTLFFDSELQVSSLGTFAQQDTQLVIALTEVDTIHKTLLCKPVSVASLRIKAFGDVNHTTQLAPILKVIQGRQEAIPPFRVDNPYYLPKANAAGSPRQGRFASKRLSKFSLPGSFRKRSHIPLEDKQGDSQSLISDSYGYSDETGGAQIMTTLESGVLLLDVSWRCKEFALETVLDLSKLKIVSNNRIITPMRKHSSRMQAHKGQDPSCSPDRSVSSLPTTDEASTNASTTGSDRSPELFTRNQSGQISVAYSTAAISTTTETTRQVSNKTKSLTKKAMQPRRKTGLTPASSSATTPEPASPSTEATPIKKKKRFWVVPVTALKMRFGKKSKAPATTTRATAPLRSSLSSKRIPLAVPLTATHSNVSTLHMGSSVAGSSNPASVSQREDDLILPGTPKSAKVVPATPRVRFDKSPKSESPTGQRSLFRNEVAESPKSQSSLFKNKMAQGEELDELNVVLGKYSASTKEEFPEQHTTGLSRVLEPNASQDPLLASIGEDSLPHEVEFEERTFDNSTITMMKGLDNESIAGNQLSLLNLQSLIPQCTLFDEDPSKLPVREGYGNLMDDDKTLATLETIDTYLKTKKLMSGNEGARGTVGGWWNDGDTTRNAEEEIMSLGGFEYHGDTDILRAHVPAFADDELSFVPRPEDVVWTELYKGCGVRTAEQLTDGFVMLPEHMFKLFEQDNDTRAIEESPTMLSSSAASNDGSEAFRTFDEDEMSDSDALQSILEVNDPPLAELDDSQLVELDDSPGRSSVRISVTGTR